MTWLELHPYEFARLKALQVKAPKDATFQCLRVWDENEDGEEDQLNIRRLVEIRWAIGGVEVTATERLSTDVSE